MEERGGQVWVGGAALVEGRALPLSLGEASLSVEEGRVRW